MSKLNEHELLKKNHFSTGILRVEVTFVQYVCLLLQIQDIAENVL